MYASPNFRRYYAGQTASLAGSWVQMVAQGWLVLELTNSPTAVGVVAIFQYVPVLLLAPYAGVLVDRLDTRRLLVATQLLAGANAGVMGVLALTHSIRLWMVYLLAAVFGLGAAGENPCRQTFVNELVGPELYTNAVTLNSVNINVGRIIGPTIAAALIRFTGIGMCFVVNAISYGVVVVALIVIDTGQLRVVERRTKTGKGALRDGFAYVRRTKTVAIPLAMVAMIGTLTYEFQVNLPAVARTTFHGDASTYSLLTGSMGVGAVIGGLATAARPSTGFMVIVRQALLLGVAVLAAAASPSLAWAVGALVVVGAASVTFLARASSTVLLSADPEYRGRIAALWTVAFLGSTPVGAPIIGAVAEHASPRISLIVSGAAALVAGCAGWFAWRRR